MLRRLVDMGVLVLCLGGLPALAQAQDASPVASPAATVEVRAPLDLAAMALFPDDVDDPDFTLQSARFVEPDELVEYLTERQVWTEEQAQVEVESLGIGRRYSLLLSEAWTADLGTPPPGENPRGRNVLSILTEYPSSEAAAAAFELLEVEAEAAPLPEWATSQEDRDLSESLGDQAELTYFGALASDNQWPYLAANLTVRSGNVIGDVQLTDFTGSEPDQDEVEALAQRLLARIEAVQAGEAPGLSQRVIRLPGAAYLDGYLRLDDHSVSLYGTPAETMMTAQAEAAEAIYWMDQDVAGTPQTPYVNTIIARFSSPEEAALIPLDELQALVAASADYANVEPVAAAPVVGEASVMFRYAYPADSPYADSTGYGMAMRSGLYVVSIMAEQPGGLPRDAAVELSEAQLACLAAGPCPDPLPVPASLLQPAATPEAPEATPVG